MAAMAFVELVPGELVQTLYSVFYSDSNKTIAKKTRPKLGAEVIFGERYG
jgi:hypothetical protein